MTFIQIVAFEESEANSTRTISLDSSTTVDDMSKITSLDITVDINLAMNSTESSDRSTRKLMVITLEETRIFQR